MEKWRLVSPAPNTAGLSTPSQKPSGILIEDPGSPRGMETIQAPVKSQKVSRGHPEATSPLYRGPERRGLPEVTQQVNRKVGVPTRSPPVKIVPQLAAPYVPHAPHRQLPE